MPAPSSPLSFDIKCGDFPAKWLVEFFVAETGHRIAAVQEFPGKVARVTFAPGGEHHKARFISAGEIVVRDVTCKVLPPPAPPPLYTHVVVFQFPYDWDNAVLA